MFCEMHELDILLACSFAVKVASTFVLFHKSALQVLKCLYLSSFDVSSVLV